jgi:hypothetical protein
MKNETHAKFRDENNNLIFIFYFKAQIKWLSRLIVAHAEVSIETWELVVSTLYMLAWKKQIVKGCSS